MIFSYLFVKNNLTMDHDFINEQMMNAKIILNQAISTREELQSILNSGHVSSNSTRSWENPYVRICPRKCLRKGQKSECGGNVYKEGICKYHFYKKNGWYVRSKVYKSTRK
jgi:hypothetical protein